MDLKDYPECDVLLIIWFTRDHCSRSILDMKRAFALVGQEAMARKLCSLLSCTPHFQLHSDCALE